MCFDLILQHFSSAKFVCIQYSIHLLTYFRNCNCMSYIARSLFLVQLRENTCIKTSQLQPSFARRWPLNHFSRWRSIQTTTRWPLVPLQRPLDRPFCPIFLRVMPTSCSSFSLIIAPRSSNNNSTSPHPLYVVLYCVPVWLARARCTCIAKAHVTIAIAHKMQHHVILVYTSLWNDHCVEHHIFNFVFCNHHIDQAHSTLSTSHAYTYKACLRMSI